MYDDSSARIARLQQILARQPTNDAQSLLARAEIAALSGKHDNAKSILAGVLDESWPYLQRDYLLLASAILVAITGNDLNTAARILNRICGSGDWFSVGQESTEIPYLLAVRWEIQDREHSIFWLNKRSDCSLQAFQILLYRLAHLLPLLASYRGCKEFTLGTVMLDMGDVPRVPGLACTGYSAKARREHFLIPDWEFMLTSGYVDMRENAKAIPWDQRVPMALWRGSTTGFPLDADRGWQSFPRVALCEIGRAHPDIIDAGITVALRPYAQMPSSELERDLRGANLMRAPMRYTDFTKYKYQIDIDGNSNSFSGPFLKLLTGSPVLKVASLYGYRQWYYERLQPWVNYVPVADDMSDLAEKIEWLRAHDDVARRIGENGHALAISLSYASEIRAAGRTIASAIRYFSCRPETELQFGIEVARDVRLLEGWAAPHEEGLVMLGQSSQLELQRPIASEAFVLTLDVSPFTNDAALPVQRIGVVVNGEVLSEAFVPERSILTCRISWRTLTAADRVRITLVHPDAACLASAFRPLDGRALSLILHGLTLTPESVYLATGEKKMDVLPFDPAQPAREASNEPRLTGPYPPYRVIGSGNDAGELRRETHLYGPDVWLPRGAQLGCIKTYWGTMVFADVERGTLRHGPEESSPRNLVISDDRDTTYLFYLTPDGNRCTLRLRPSGEGVGRGSATDQPVGRPQAFRAVQTLVDGQIKFGLWSVGFFLSAEEDGRITLSRRALGPWEQFRFMDPADEAEDVSQSVTNVALDKPALQSSISEWSLGRTIEADACIATNGDITSNIFFHTDHEVSPWWQVDLQEEFIIESIRIFNRRDIPERLKHFTVLTSLTGETGDWLKLYRKDTDIIFGRDDDPFVIIPDTQWIARFVRIRLDQVGFLHLRECEVLGRRPAFDDLSRFRAQTRELQQRAIEEEARHTRELVNGRIGCITKIDSYSVFVDTDKYSSVLVTELSTGGYEALERQVVKATVRPDDRVLELGTAVGVVTMTIASIVGPTNVITYDANPVIIADARRNFAANGYGEISANVGVMRNRSCWSPVEAETDFFIARDFWASRLHATADSCDIASVVRVPLVCLEDVIEEHRANVLVCDIEGAEAELLLGADLSPIQMIVMETHYWACGRRKIDEMIRFLIMSGFEINLDHTASHIVVFDRNK